MNDVQIAIAAMIDLMAARGVITESESNYIKKNIQGYLSVHHFTLAIKKVIDGRVDDE